jgi:hypothetical protein
VLVVVCGERELAERVGVEVEPAEVAVGFGLEGAVDGRVVGGGGRELD